MTYLLEIAGITKSFLDIKANNNISLKLKEGEIHALLGENGAGKSTLVKIIYGILKPDSGKMLLNGEEYNPENPDFARKQGIGMVFQHFSLFESLSVIDNLMLGQDEHVSRLTVMDQLSCIKDEYDLYLDLNKTVATLSAGEKQKVEIMRCLLQDPKIIILDEPTSVLNPEEVKKFFYFLKKLSSEGVVILYISHKLQEIKELCDFATILRNGNVVKYCDPKILSINELAKFMIGKDINQSYKLSEVEDIDVMNINNINYNNPELYGISLQEINFNVQKGEIFGIAGIAGNGQSELMKVLSGEINNIKQGSILFHGKEINYLSINDRRKKGMVFIPEDRSGHGAIGNFSLIDNLLLTNLWDVDFFKNGVIDYIYSAKKTKEVIDEFNVICKDENSLASSLSGGNLQKFVVGREILKGPDIIVCEQPTWGVDIGSANMIHDFLLDKAKMGATIIIISQDIDELRKICHRMAIISNGKLSKIYDASSITSENIAIEMAK
jgi:general nucleoside transport system ATP-binding protein